MQAESLKRKVWDLEDEVQHRGGKEPRRKGQKEASVTLDWREREALIGRDSNRN